MTVGQKIAASACVSLIASVAIIIVVGYYHSASALPEQIALTAIPIFAPLGILSLSPRLRWPHWLSVAALEMGAWAWVVQIDRQPYPGGGASFAVVIGWAGSALALVLALALLMLKAPR